MRVKLPLRLYKALLALMTCAGTISAFTLQTGNAQGWAPANIEYTKDVTAAGSSGGWATTDMTGDHLLNQNTFITFTTNGNVGTPFNCPGLHIKLSTQALGAQMNVNADMTASSVWFAGGRYLSNGANRYNNVGKVYVVGGQLWLDTATVTIADITLGASTYTEGNVFNQASLRISGNSTFTKATIVEDTKIAFDASKTLTINELVGTNQITFDNFAGTNYVRLNSGYEGNLSVTGVTLNLGTNNTNYKSILLGAGSTLQVLTDVTSNLESISSTEANSRILLQGATSVLNLTGTENQTHAGTLSGTGAINKNGAGILTLSGNLSAFTGDFNLNEGTLELTGTAMNGKLVIKQNNVNIKGNSSSFKHIEIASDVTLNASTHMTDGLTLTSGSLTLNANSIFVGDLTLNSSSLIIKGASDSMPTVTGSITCTGSELDLRSLANISSGDAVLNVSQTVTGADSFSVLLQNGAPAYASFENNKLVVYIRDSVNTLNWGGSGSNWNQDNAWVKDGTSQAISFQQGDSVQFGIDYTNAQTITIDKTQVLSGLSIAGTADHTFNGTGSLSLRSNTIYISSTGTTNINLSNTTLEDNIVKLENGTLNLGAANALGSGTLNATNATINANSSGALNNIAINLDHSILTATNEQGTSLGEANKAGQITATNGSTINLAATDAVTNAITLSGHSNLNAQNVASNRINGHLHSLIREQLVSPTN